MLVFGERKDGTGTVGSSSLTVYINKAPVAGECDVIADLSRRYTWRNIECHGFHDGDGIALYKLFGKKKV